MSSSTSLTPNANRSRNDHRLAAEPDGVKGKALIVSNNIRQKAARLLVIAFVAVTTLHASPSRGQAADIKQRLEGVDLEGVDLEGVEQLRLSPNGELVAGLTKPYDNPAPMPGSFCLIKIWSVKKKQLVHKFRVPGAVYEAAFSPDSGTLVSADKTGNLGYTTKIRAWNLVDGSERQVGVFLGVSNKFCFSPDGNRLSAIQFPEYSFLNPLGEYTFKLNVWQVKERGWLSINIPNALGDHRATFPFRKWDGNPDSDERVQKSLERVTPVLRGFSPDGKQLICDFETGARTYDARSGSILQRPDICSVSLFKSMLMIAPQQAPANVKSLSIELMPGNKNIRLEKGADGWWRADMDETSDFKVDGKQFVSPAGDVETKEDILMLLGLKNDSSLADLSSLRHPLGVIKIDRNHSGLEFRLEEMKDGVQSTETLQAGKVRWTSTVVDSEELPAIQLPGSDAWKQLKSNAERTLWYEDSGNYYILQTYKTPRALPLDDIEKFRAFARRQASAMNGGLVEARYVQCNGRRTGYFIVKNTYQDLMGYRYIGRCVIPVEGGAYEVGMDALPIGITGKREAVLNIELGLLANLTMEEIPAEAPPTPGHPAHKPGDKRIKGIFKDPYDAKFDAAANYSPTDDAKFDTQFPKHPLSRVRDKLSKLIESVVINDEGAGVEATENSTRIAVSVLDQEHGGIYVLNAGGSEKEKQRLTKGNFDILPRWSPDGKQIAFLAMRKQDHELAAEHDLAFHWFLYVMDADGQNPRRVTKTPVGMIFQWSPDGTRFVFQSSWEDVNNKAKDGTVSSAIYVMRSDGTQQKRVTFGENNDSFPSWSPDGKQIAFCSNRHGNNDIFVMNAEGSDVRRLTSHEANDSAPIWSPDGKQIAFTSSREIGAAYTVNADGTGESFLAVSGRPVTWSSDGQSLLIENDGQLVLSSADGKNPKELILEGKSALDGEYSPDGKAVFYRSKVNETWTLMSVDIERLKKESIWSDSGKLLGFSVCPQ